MRLDREQAAKLSKQLYPHANYITRLYERMPVAGFPVNDPLYQAVARVRDAMIAVCMEVNYQSCASGIGRKPDDAPDPSELQRGG
jgi:hypothetical protein